nr:oxidoreductase [Mammaliicoccus sp. Marseille-Q6498]
MKKFGIIGPGAVGTAITYALLQSGQNVSLYGKTNQEIEFQEYHHDDKHQIPVQSLQTAHEKHDILFIAVKTTQLDDIIPYLNNIIHSNSMIILTQNGYGQLDKIFHFCKYQAVVYISGQKDKNLVTHFRDWTLKLPRDEHTLELQNLTQDSLLNIECLEDYRVQVWYKLIVNLGINTITAITKQPAKVLKSDGIEALCYNLLSEGKKVAQAEGIHFQDDLEESIMNIYRGYPDDMGTSMYYDTMNRRPLELEYIQGYIYRMSQKHKLDTPLLDSTYAILKTFQPE